MAAFLLVFILYGIYEMVFVPWRDKQGIDTNRFLNTYGPPSFFLRGLINELKSHYPEHRVVVENSNRLKIIFYTNFFKLDLDITYRDNYILIELLMDILHNKRGRILKCPYNATIVESEFRSKMIELLTM